MINPERIIDGLQQQGYSDAATLSGSGMQMLNNLEPSHLVLRDSLGVEWLAQCVALRAGGVPEFVIFNRVKI